MCRYTEDFPLSGKYNSKSHNRVAPFRDEPREPGNPFNTMGTLSSNSIGLEVLIFMRRLHSTKAWECTRNWFSLMDVTKQSTTQQLSTRQLIKAELHAATRIFETFPRCFSLSRVFSPMALAHAHFCKESFARHYDSCWNLYGVPNYKTHAPPVTISREQTRDATIKTSVDSNLWPVLISCAKN